MEYLHNKKANLIFSLLLGVVCVQLFYKSGALEGAGMAALFLHWLPLMVSVFAIVVYLIWRRFSSTTSWVATAFGALLNISLVVRGFMEVAS